MKNSNSKFNEFAAKLSTENVLTETQSMQVKGGGLVANPLGSQEGGN